VQTRAVLMGCLFNPIVQLSKRSKCLKLQDCWRCGAKRFRTLKGVGTRDQLTKCQSLTDHRRYISNSQCSLGGVCRGGATPSIPIDHDAEELAPVGLERSWKRYDERPSKFACWVRSLSYDRRTFNGSVRRRSNSRSGRRSFSSAVHLHGPDLSV
jgi:hypothetical protein